MLAEIKSSSSEEEDEQEKKNEGKYRLNFYCGDDQ